MNGITINKTLLQGQIAGRGKLYNSADCPYTPGSRRAHLWKDGFDNGREGKPLLQEVGYGDNRKPLTKS